MVHVSFLFIYLNGNGACVILVLINKFLLAAHSTWLVTEGLVLFTVLSTEDR